MNSIIDYLDKQIKDLHDREQELRNQISTSGNAVELAHIVERVRLNAHIIYHLRKVLNHARLCSVSTPNPSLTATSTKLFTMNITFQRDTWLLDNGSEHWKIPYYLILIIRNAHNTLIDRDLEFIDFVFDSTFKEWRARVYNDGTFSLSFQTRLLGVSTIKNLDIIQGIYLAWLSEYADGKQ